MEPEDMPFADFSSAKDYIGAVYERQWMKTTDGVQIEPGLKVFTYDYVWGAVSPEDFERVMKRNEGYKARDIELTSSDFWFNIENEDGTTGLMNGERMITRCTRCGKCYEECSHH